MYVRKINISGNVKTRDEVIRREMRQLEAAWYDGTRIERSKVRIKRLGYFEDVNIETPPVQGTPDEADVEVTVTEKSTGQLLAGVGYSSADGVVLNASISQQNIFGSGNALDRVDQHEQGQPHDLDRVHRAVLDGRRHLAHDRDLPEEHRHRLARRHVVHVVDVRRRDRLRHPDHRDRLDHRRVPRRAHEHRIPVGYCDPILGLAPPIYYLFVNQFGYAVQQLHRHRRLVP